MTISPIAISGFAAFPRLLSVVGSLVAAASVTCVSAVVFVAAIVLIKLGCTIVVGSLSLTA